MEETDPQVKLSKWDQMIFDFVEDIFMCGFIMCLPKRPNYIVSPYKANLSYYSLY